MVMDDQYTDLIQQALDDEISDRDREVLDRYLARSPEALETFRRMARLLQAPAFRASVEPPSDLKIQVLQSIDPSRYGADTSRRPWARFREYLHLVSTPRLAYGVAMGLLLGVALGALGVSGYDEAERIDPSVLSGSLTMSDPAQNAHRFAEESFAGNQVFGRMTADHADGMALIRFELSANRKVTMILEFEPDAWAFQAFHQQTQESTQVVTRPGRIEVSHQGRNLYLFRFGLPTERSTRLTYRILTDAVIYQGEISRPGR